MNWNTQAIPSTYAEWDARFHAYVNEGSVEQALDAWSRAQTYRPAHQAEDRVSRDRYMRGAYAISAQKSLTLLERCYTGNLTPERTRMRNELVTQMLHDAQQSGDEGLLSKVETKAYSAPRRFFRQQHEAIRTYATNVKKQGETFFAKVDLTLKKMVSNPWCQSFTRLFT